MSDKIRTIEGIEATCLGCHEPMPYRVTDETAAGHTIQVPLRYCKSCHDATLSDLALRRRISYESRAFDMIAQAIFKPFAQGGGL